MHRLHGAGLQQRSLTVVEPLVGTAPVGRSRWSLRDQFADLETALCEGRYLTTRSSGPACTGGLLAGVFAPATQRERYTGSVVEPRNDRYSAANVVTILIGGLLLILAVVGTFMPE